ncbi:uncharacterized protein EI90DRAFT_925993 [Cantharellus anzutake]|uniref:uncharacterized protein n=1 Tax=Cantharellus anzutake TaxID=1750568 RepID=UPI00190723F7|nr:uncharacterized protein EI90DRAFT_925993 [Cantharellus anzutake]KAF8332112.1 hypothetical protein EI90DRAFT_925993 [Cantharellus anzutake]
MLFKTARVQLWRRCPGCKIVIELKDGCRHIICRCKTQFCYRCGALWSDGKCSRTPPCELWSEDELIRHEQEEEDPPSPETHPQLGQQLFHVQEAFGPPRTISSEPLTSVLQEVIEALAHPPEPKPNFTAASIFSQSQRARAHNVLHWSEGPGENTTDWNTFTADMIARLTCGYCSRRFFNLRALEQHLNHVQKHLVFKCCEKCFRESDDLRRHKAAVHG